MCTCITVSRIAVSRKKSSARQLQAEHNVSKVISTENCKLSRMTHCDPAPGYRHMFSGRVTMRISCYCLSSAVLSGRRLFVFLHGAVVQFFMRESNFDGAKIIGTPFELPEASDVCRTPSTNAHNLTTVTNILPRESIPALTQPLHLLGGKQTRTRAVHVRHHPVEARHGGKYSYKLFQQGHDYSRLFRQNYDYTKDFKQSYDYRVGYK